MALLTIRILDANGTVKCADSAEGFASLVFRGEYAPGDCIEVESSEKNIHLRLQLDDALGAEFVYMTDKIRYMVPFAEKRVNLSPKAFWGADHYLYVRELTFETKKIRWVRLSHLLKADDPSPFPALAQLEVYGRVAR